MNLLKTSPVVIIDDEAAEAIPVMRALGRLGVGCVYIPGDRLEQLPEKPIAGVRLVFMDMQLGTHGTPRQVGSQAANVFCRSIDAGTVPVVVVLWTKHEEDVEAFKTALFHSEPRFRAATLVTRLEKPQQAEDIDVEDLRKRIVSLVDSYPPLAFIWGWEQLAHDAATETTNALGNLVMARVDPDTIPLGDAERLSAWLDALCHVLRSLVHVAAGQNVDSKTAHRDVLEVLAPLHQDRLERELIASATGEFPDVLRIKWEGPSSPEEVAVNTMLLVAPVHKDDLAVKPGNLYLAQPDLGDSCLHAMCRVSAERIARELLQPTKDKCYETMGKEIQEYHKRGAPAGDITSAEHKMNARFQELLGECKPVLLEISPACDYAQRSREVARFVGGLLVPDKHANLIVGRKPSVLRIEAVSLPGMDGAWHPVFSARFAYTLPEPDNVVKSKPICRLRTPVLVNTVSWCAAHASRPGYLSLRKS